MEQKSAVHDVKLNAHDASEIMGGGICNAVAGLAQMSGQEITVTSITFKKIPVKDIPDLFGGGEALIIAVYLEISGNTNGHMMVAYQPSVAFDLIDLLLGQPSGSTTGLSEMEQSTLGEVGNIMGSYFLNHISDATGCSFQPSPPAVIMDMAGAILDAALAGIMAYSDYTYIIETTFGTNDRQVSGTFLVVPDTEMEIE